MTLDRSSPPPASGPLAPRLPTITRLALENGLRVAATNSTSTPETLIELSIPGGRVHEPLAKLGQASLVAKMLPEGTVKLATIELIDALDFLGAELHVGSDDDELTVSLRVLDKHLERALEIFTDVLLEPRFDARDYERIAKLRLAAIATRGDDAGTVAANVWRRLLHGDATSLGFPSLGLESTVRALSVDDLWAFHRASLDPARSSLSIVGRWDADDLARMFAPLARRWPAPLVAPRETPAPQLRSAAPGLYNVDRPGAPQTELHLGHLSVSATHPDQLALSALNYPLGGQFTSRINLNLREQKGFTYGARSSFDLAPRPAPFGIHAAVHTQHTAASITESIRELREYLDGPTEAEIQFTHDALEQSLARQFESPAARLSYLRLVTRFGWPDDYPLQRLAQLQALGRAGLRDLARTHIHPERLIVLTVGSRAALDDFTALGPVHALDLDGRPI